MSEIDSGLTLGSDSFQGGFDYLNSAPSPAATSFDSPLTAIGPGGEATSPYLVNGVTYYDYASALAASQNGGQSTSSNPLGGNAIGSTNPLAALGGILGTAAQAVAPLLGQQQQQVQQAQSNTGLLLLLGVGVLAIVLLTKK